MTVLPYCRVAFAVPRARDWACRSWMEALYSKITASTEVSKYYTNNVWSSDVAGGSADREAAYRCRVTEATSVYSGPRAPHGYSHKADLGVFPCVRSPTAPVVVIDLEEVFLEEDLDSDE